MAGSGPLRRRCSCLVALVWAGWLALTSAAATAESYTFAVVPHFEGRQLFTIWKPILERVEQRTGLSLSLIAMLSLPEFEREYTNGSFDFAFTSSYLAMRDEIGQGYIPLVRDAVALRGILVVARASPIQAVSELDGKLLAVPSLNAMAASLMLRAELELVHNVRMHLLNAKTHTSVYLHVANGLADAGGGAERTLKEQKEPVRNALRVLHITRDIPAHPITAHPRVSQAVRERLRQALLELADTSDGQELLAAVPISRPVAASVEEYRLISEWGLERFWTPGGEPQP